MNASKKISVLAPDLSGGGATRVYLLATVLRKLNYDVTVFGPIFGEKFYPIPPADLTVTSVPGCNYPQFFQSINNLLQQIDGDIIYAVKPRLTSYGIGLLKRLQKRKPLILDMDDWELSWFGGDSWQYQPTLKQLGRDIIKINGALRNPEHPLYLQWMENLINKADALTVNNQFLQERFGGIYLPNGKDTDLFNPEKFSAEVSRQKYHLSPYKILMFPGTARPHKGLEDVLTALDKLNREDLRLVLVGGRDIGDGYVESLFSQWGRWLIKLPSTPIEAMAEVVAAAHIIVVPQRQSVTASAQFPIKLTDGMAMAKPILATNVGDIGKILGDTGFLVEANAPEQIAEQITWILANLTFANERGLKARERCIEYYSLTTMATILDKIIASF